jgi:raffinose/stachyose/melibiose transport system permease protein
VPKTVVLSFGTRRLAPRVNSDTRGLRSRRLGRTHRAGRAWIAGLAMVVVALIWVVPLVGVVFTALKSPAAAFASGPLSPPRAPTLENFGNAWSSGNLGAFGLRSLVITLIKVPLGLLMSAMAGFGFSRYRFRGKAALFFVLVAGAMIPLQIILIPLFSIMLALHLLNNYVGLLLVYEAFGFPIEVLLLRSFFNQIPNEVDEAARVDGVGSFGRLFRIFLPLSKPILAALFILDFVSTWNEFQIALVLLQTRNRFTLPLGLLQFQEGMGGQFTLMAAAVLMASAPALIVYVFLQRYFVAGLTTGAVRG